METIFWQAMDQGGRTYKYTARPKLLSNGCYSSGGECCSHSLFPIALKPLECVKVIVTENYSWACEFEKEEGWYMAKWSDKVETVADRKATFAEYKGGKYFFPSGQEISQVDLNYLTISSTRIPDECII